MKAPHNTFDLAVWASLEKAKKVRQTGSSEFCKNKNDKKTVTCEVMYDS